MGPLTSVRRDDALALWRGYTASRAEQDVVLGLFSFLWPPEVADPH